MIMRTFKDFEFKMNNHEKELKTMLWTKLRFVNEKGSSANHPAKLIEYLSAVSCENVNFEKINFDMRVVDVKKSVRNGEIELY